MKCDDFPTCQLVALKDHIIDRERQEKTALIEQMQSILRNEQNANPIQIFDQLATLFFQNEENARELFPQNMNEAFQQRKKNNQMNQSDN